MLIVLKCEFFGRRHYFGAFMTLTFLAVLKTSMVHIGQYTFRIKFVFFLKLSLDSTFVMTSWWFFIINFEQFSDFAVVLTYCSRKLLGTYIETKTEVVVIEVVLVLTLNIFYIKFYCFFGWFWEEILGTYSDIVLVF